MAKPITMLFPNGKDTLNTTEDMVAHYKGMGYSVAGEKKKKPASAPSVSEQRRLIKQYMINLNETDPAKESEEYWTMGGVPNANVMSESLGFEVSATVRDEIWKEVNK